MHPGGGAVTVREADEHRLGRGRFPYSLGGLSDARDVPAGDFLFTCVA